MDIKIIRSVLDVFEHYGDYIRFDIDRFEEAINDEAPDCVNECYLIVLGMKLGVFDAMIFDEEIEVKGYVQYLMEVVSLKEEEAVFMISAFQVLIEEMGYYFEIPHIQELLDSAYSRQDLRQLEVIAKTYFLGFGIEQDYEKSFEIYDYLYGQGYDRGAYYLGYMYEYGLGVEKNSEKALMFYSSHEDDLCLERMGLLMMRNGDHDEEALDYFTRSHKDTSYYYQGMLLEEKREYALAFNAFLQGAHLYQKDCLYKVGYYFQLGLGVEMNLEKAYDYFKLGYDLLNGECAYALSMIHLDDILYPKDIPLALHYLQQATELGSLQACLTFARFYKAGCYVDKDMQKSLEYYQKANDIQTKKREIMSKEVGGIYEDL